LKELELLRVENAESDLVFPFKSVRTAFENARKKAGLENLTFHDLRRTFGTRLLEMGVDIVTIQKLYGHSSVLVTQRYLHPQDSIKKEAVELLDHAGKMKADPFHICSTEKEGKPLIH
jgi:integrase